MASVVLLDNAPSGLQGQKTPRRGPHRNEIALAIQRDAVKIYYHATTPRSRKGVVLTEHTRIVSKFSFRNVAEGDDKFASFSYWNGTARRYSISVCGL
jgi:hypothetical protein